MSKIKILSQKTVAFAIFFWETISVASKLICIKNVSVMQKTNIRGS